jgi:hypothetical protein
MNPKYFISRFFIWLAVILSLSPIQSRAGETTTVSGVLGRNIRLDALCDDFENTKWCFDYQKHESYNGFWRGGSGRGEPELVTRVTAPDGGRSGSTGALEIRTNKVDSDSVPNQEDFLTVDYKQKLGRELTRADQPVFIVRVWLPTFDQWGDYYSFGFRHESFPKNSNKYYPTIWLKCDKRSGIRPFFVFRIGTGMANDVYGGPIEQCGWWTLAIAFDKNGVGSYYACPGINIPTEKNKMFDTTRFITMNGTDNPSMNYIAYSFFSLGYPVDGNTSPRFIIDDYEVWVIKDSK